MEWFGKAKNFVIDKAKSVGIPIPVVEKTVDPAYDQAKEQFKKLKLDTEKIIGSIVQMNTQLKTLASATKRFGDDLSTMFVNTQQNTKNEAKGISLFGGQFEKFTENILNKQIDSGVVSPLAVYHKEIKRLQVVKEKRKVARKEYDESRAKLKAYKDSNQKYEEVMAINAETEKAFQKYNELNQDFIMNVNRLAMQRTQSLDLPFRNLTNIMSQYLMQVFNEMSRMKVSFPPQVFAPRVPMAPVGTVPQAQPMPMPQQPMQMQFSPPPPPPVEENPYAGLA